MTKVEISAIALIVITAGGIAISTLTNNETVTTKAQAPAPAKLQPNNARTIEPRQSDQSKLLPSIDRRDLPVAHGIADKDGKQISPTTGKRLRSAPPPPMPAPDSRHRKTANHNSHSHGHETSHNSAPVDANSPPPPTGSN